MMKLTGTKLSTTFASLVGLFASSLTLAADKKYNPPDPVDPTTREI